MRDLNFFSTLEKQKQSSKSKRSVVILIFAVTVFLICAAYVSTEYIASGINRDINEKKAHLEDADISKKSAEITEKKQMLETMNQYLTNVAGAETSISNAFNLKSTFIEQLNNVIPTGVVFNNYEINSTSFTAQYTASNKALIAEMYKRMLALGAFDNVYIPNISKATDGTGSYSFSIQCTMNGGTAK